MHTKILETPAFLQMSEISIVTLAKAQSFCVLLTPLTYGPCRQSSPRKTFAVFASWPEKMFFSCLDILRSGFTRILLTLLMLLMSTASVVAAPLIKSWNTSNGAKVMFVEAPSIPMLDVRLVFDAGSARDDGKPGIASLVSTLLSDGAGEWNADQLAERFEDVGASFSTTSLRDMGIISMRTLVDAEVLDSSLQTLQKVISSPSFAAEAIERRKKQINVALEKQKESPSSTASIAFYQSLYGDHPYAHNSLGNVESIKAITRQDILDWFKQYYVGSNTVIAIVGAVDRKRAEEIAERLMTNVAAGEKPRPLAEVKVSKKGVERRIEFPSSQTHLLFGQPVMARQDEDFYALYVGNHMLGGSGLVSMLGEEVREKRGLAYSVSSHFIPMRGKGPYLFSAQTRNEQSQQTLKVMKQSLRDFIKDGPTKKRLIASIRNITGGFPLRISSNSKIVEYLAMMGFYDYPLDHLNTFVEKIAAVTAKQIRDAFSHRVNPDHFVIVQVGGSGKDGNTTGK
jgi:zinc protease